MNKISIIIGTKNRPFELKNCIHSILFSDSLKSCCLEIMIIDDGNLETVLLTQLKITIEKSGCRFKYFKKNERPNLFYSRREGIKQSEGEIVLFLDDDTEIEKDYLIKLTGLYEKNPDVTGISGVDTLLRINLLQRIYYNFFLMSSLCPGKFSVSSFCYSHLSWVFQTKSFYSEFLIGHNMSFKKSAVTDIGPVSWFDGHCPGEDIYLSLLANLKGRLLVDPDLKVKHFRVPTARDSVTSDQCQYVANFFRLMLFRNPSLKNYMAFAWTMTGLIIRSILKLNVREFIGNIYGIEEILKILICK